MRPAAGIANGLRRFGAVDKIAGWFGRILVLPQGAARDRLLAQLKGLEKDAFSKGMQDAADCKPQNTAGYCVGLQGKAAAECNQNYHNGYRVGQIEAESLLLAAHAKGQHAKSMGQALPDHGRQATDKCGVKWLAAHNSGHAGNAFTMVGR